MFNSPIARDVNIGSPTDIGSSDSELKRIRRAMEISIDEEVSKDDVN